jgi:hypothetical protein
MLRAVRQVASTRNPGAWNVGDMLWGIEGTALVFEDRYALYIFHFVPFTDFSTRYDGVDHISNARLSPALVMETRNRRKLEAFVSRRRYICEAGDPEESD